MRPRARIVGGATRAAALVSVLAGALGAKAPSPVPEPRGAWPGELPAAQARSAPPEALGAFRDALERVRSGDEGQLSVARELAARLAREFDRPDAREVLEFFARIPLDDRRRGLEAEREYERVREAVQAAARDDIDSWRAKRPAILAELEAIAARSAAAPDCTPAARALALKARIALRRIRDDTAFAAEERAAWVEECRADALESRELFERAGMLTPRIEPLWVLAWLDYVQGSVALARDEFEDALALARKLDRPEWVKLCLEGALPPAEEAGDVAAVSALLLELAAHETPRDSWPLARAQARLLLWIDEPDRAAEFLTRNAPQSPADQRQWHVLMSSAQTRRGADELAEAHAEQSTGPDAAVARAAALRRRGDARGALAILVSVFGPGLVAPPANPMLEAQFGLERGAACLALGQRAEAIAAFEFALRTGESIEGRLAPIERFHETGSVFGESIGLETVALLARARAEDGDPLGAAREIEARQSRHLRALTSESAAGDPSREDVVQWAAAFELGLVTWVIGADTSLVVHVARGGTASARAVPCGRKALESAVRRVREAAIAGDDARARELAAELERAILPRDIASRIPPSPAVDGARLLLLAHGPLERLPFELLPIFADTHTRTIVPVVLPGLPARDPGAPLGPAAFEPWVILGDPLDARGAVRLPGAREEIEAVAAAHDGSFVARARDFTAERMRRALTGHGSIHVATHVRARPDESGLAHAAFELSGDASFDVDSIRDARPKLALACLSACETGVGQVVDAEVSLGVARAFLASGTRNVLVTLWPVEDGAARAYASAFHAALSRGRSPSRAATFARETLRARGASPADWAAFRLLGRD